MRRGAARSPRSGFTILELLTVVVILVVLAGIAITRYQASKRRAYVAVMLSDLRLLAMAAESRFIVENTYVGAEVPAGSAGVSLVFDGTPSGWIASATHASLPGFWCTIRSGGDADAVPVCR